MIEGGVRYFHRNAPSGSGWFHQAWCICDWIGTAHLAREEPKGTSFKKASQELDEHMVEAHNVRRQHE